LDEGGPLRIKCNYGARSCTSFALGDPAPSVDSPQVSPWDVSYHLFNMSRPRPSALVGPVENLVWAGRTGRVGRLGTDSLDFGTRSTCEKASGPDDPLAARVADHSRRAARTPVPIRQSHFLNAFPLAHRLEARNVSLERVRGPRGAEPELNRAQLALCGGDKCGGIEHKQFIPWLTPCGHR
jgi:hypothetical protein